ncbi:hypothetical protein FQN50_003319 [Emmonsiellopsis sp. PD_5]|nr:hypothetical protein FQN50_003319 [Emmonsiellopsis sp. PD_5]
MENPAIHKLKRKRANSGESDTAAPETTQTPKAEARPQETSSNGKIAAPQPTPTPVNAQPKHSPPADTPLHGSLPPKSPAVQPGEDHPPGQAKPDPAPPAAIARKMNSETLRRTLESQLSLEILLKHEELRLIDQEMAKCQVALDQLRRCAEIPYPGSNVAGPSSSVSSGIGSAILPSRPGPPPISPSPWGVSDGPYSRHYSKWLIPDPRFDGGEAEPMIPASAAAGAGPADGRTTRGSWAEQSIGGALRSQRSSAGTKLQALSSGYPQPKDKAGPMIIKRKSDGQLVKLVCLDCRRDNFSSTQGFINHCRIAHNRNFASHDAAAAASGEPVEVDEAGMVIGNNNETPSGGPVGYVHPLIRSARLVESTPQPGGRRGSSLGQQSKKSGDTGSSRGSSNQPDRGSPSRDPRSPSLPSRPQNLSITTPSPSFKASPETPNLSALMQRRGMSLDLLDIVDDALTKTDMDMFSSEDESSDEPEEGNTQANQDRSQLSVRGSRLPARTIVSPSQPPRPGSRKGTDKPSRKPQPPTIPQAPTPQDSYRSPYAPTTGSSHTLRIEQQRSQGNGIDMMVDPICSDLSPNTVESNQAPSLVSDDEDYEAPSESESPSPAPSETSDDGRGFDNIEVRDGDDGNGGPNVSTATTSDTKPGPEIPSPSKHHPSPVPRTAPVYKKKGSAKSKSSAKETESTTLNRANDKDQRRVSFVSPMASPTKVKKDGGKRQRRG